MNGIGAEQDGSAKALVAYDGAASPALPGLTDSDAARVRDYTMTEMDRIAPTEADAPATIDGVTIDLVRATAFRLAAALILFMAAVGMPQWL